MHTGIHNNESKLIRMNYACKNLRNTLALADLSLTAECSNLNSRENEDIREY